MAHYKSGGLKGCSDSPDRSCFTSLGLLLGAIELNVLYVE